MTDPGMCQADPVSGDGLILPEAFPCRAGDLDTAKIEGAAADLRSMGNTVGSLRLRG